jgi:hypothetical protein
MVIFSFTEAFDANLATEVHLSAAAISVESEGAGGPTGSVGADLGTGRPRARAGHSSALR